MIVQCIHCRREGLEEVHIMDRSGRPTCQGCAPEVLSTAVREYASTVSLSYNRKNNNVAASIDTGDVAIDVAWTNDAVHVRGRW